MVFFCFFCKIVYLSHLKQLFAYQNKINIMNQLVIEKTKHTPEILFDATQNSLIIKGRSLPENANEFYKPILNWITNYVNLKPQKTNISFDLDYFNTASAKAIFSILRKLETLHKENENTEAIWYYDVEDEDLKDVGIEFKNIFKFPILVKEK